MPQQDWSQDLPILFLQGILCYKRLEPAQRIFFFLLDYHLWPCFSSREKGEEEREKGNWNFQSVMTQKENWISERRRESREKERKKRQIKKVSGFPFHPFIYAPLCRMSRQKSEIEWRAIVKLKDTRSPSIKQVFWLFSQTLFSGETSKTVYKKRLHNVYSIVSLLSADLYDLIWYIYTHTDLAFLCILLQVTSQWSDVSTPITKIT